MLIALSISIIVPGIVFSIYYFRPVRHAIDAPSGAHLDGAGIDRHVHACCLFVRLLLCLHVQVPHKTVYDIISDDFLTTGSDSSPDYWKYMIYVFISANWDAILLAIAMFTVRWRQLVRPRPELIDRT